MPDEGESIQQLFENVEVFAGSLVPAALRQVPFTNPDGSQGVDLYLDREAFPGAFCADVGPETAKVMAATQRPWGGAGYATPSSPPAWRSIPSWHLVGTEDRAIPPAGQRFMAERGNARIEEVAASHASMVSPAGGRDVADPERRGGDQARRGGERVTAVPRPPRRAARGRPFAGSEPRDLQTSRGAVHAVVGGSGAPVLLLHGYPDASTAYVNEATRAVTSRPGSSRSSSPPSSGQGSGRCAN